MRSTVPFGFYIREAVIQGIRNFFIEQNFHEVITPTINRGLPLEPNIYAFTTQWEAAEEKIPLYLSTSPESGLKKMIAAGVGNCFAFGKCFRNLERSGVKHNPEFMMLEWYREDAEYWQIMRDIQEVVQKLLPTIKSILEKNNQSTDHLSLLENKEAWPHFSLEELFAKHAGIQFTDILTDDQLMAVAKQKGYSTEGATWSQLFDQIFLNEVEKHLPLTPCFLIDFPARLSPLCQVNKQKSYLAERFEFFMNGVEIANGNNEYTNVDQIRQSMEKEKATRAAVGLFTPPIDEEFLTALAAMKQSGHHYAGVGLGIDRLAMMLGNIEDIADVEFFAVRSQ